MTGTSLDSIDIAWVRETHAGGPVEVLAAIHTPLSDSVIARCQTVIEGRPFTAAEFSQLEADYTTDLLDGLHQFQETCPDMAPAVLGCHGQTLFHHPTAQTSWQLVNPHPLAQSLRCPVAFDFRRNDLAAGGQGAPLAPLFHCMHFAREGESVAVLNLGGIANVTLLDTPGAVRGFDTGPAKTLLDQWMQTQFGARYDHNGHHAAQAMVIQRLRDAWLDDPYFARQPPKSTGREYFNLHWLETRSPTPTSNYAPQDVLRTLVELTTVSAASALPADLDILLVAGGGALNPVIMASLDQQTAALVSTTDIAGIPAQDVESTCFAWLGLACLDQRRLATPSVTGSARSVILGVIAPGY